MILDTLINAELYYACHPLFRQAFEILRSGGSTEPGNTGLKLIKISKPGEDKAGALLETHRKYIDIQYTVAGTDVIGWRPMTEKDVGRGYDEAKDIEFFDHAAQSWFDVREGSFAIFFPGDGHAPMASPEHITKLVVKVPIHAGGK